MKNLRSKKLIKRISTVCDFNRGNSRGSLFDTNMPTETDPTTATVTIIITTANTHAKA
ncbi:MAG: hypothetical protein V4553_09060 [Bacteroidota bacterium]